MTHLRADRDDEAKIVIGRALLDKHGLHEWEFKVENLNHGLAAAIYGAPPEGYDHGGLTDFARKIIRIDIGVGPEFREMVLHEIAHVLRGEVAAVNPEQAHDREWIAIAGQIGCDDRQLFPYALALVRNGSDDAFVSDEDYWQAEQLLAVLLLSRFWSVGLHSDPERLLRHGRPHGGQASNASSPLRLTVARVPDAPIILRMRNSLAHGLLCVAFGLALVRPQTTTPVPEATHASEPTGSVSGHVYCADTNQPARYANVTLLAAPEKDAVIYSATGLDGSFSFPKSSRGNTS